MMLLPSIPAAAAPLPPGGTFVDDDGSVHEGDIEALVAAGITEGCAGNLFCPNEPITRGELAAFLRRALSWPAGPDAFIDDDHSIFETDLDAAAAAGAIRGCDPPTNSRSCPDQRVDRGQLAAVLTRALDLPPPRDRDRFVDDNGSVFEADIDRLASAGITQGCDPPVNLRFCPEDPVTRAQAASFVTRALGLTPNAPPPRPSAAPIWRAGHEGRTLGEWDIVSNSGTYEASVDCERARSGDCAAAATIGSSGGVRLTYQGRDLAEASDPRNLPDDAYYSAWYFIPSFVENSWWNIFQWKQGYQTGPSARTARELYWIVLNDSSAGDLRLGLRSRVTPEGDWVSGQTNVLVNSQVSVPIGRWFHLESRYRWDQGGNGRITTWLDGRQVWDIGGLTTEFGWEFWVWNRQWTVNSYGSGIDPAPFTIWIDDAAVATARIGP